MILHLSFLLPHLALEEPPKKMVATVGAPGGTSTVRLRTKTSLDSLDEEMVTPKTKNNASPTPTPTTSTKGISTPKSFLDSISTVPTCSATVFKCSDVCLVST